LAFGVAIVPFSWPFLAILPAMLLVSLPLSHAGIASGWWRTLPPPAAVGWLLTEFTVLSLAAAVTGRMPGGAAVPVGGLAGLLNARAWFGVTAAVTRPRAAQPQPVPAPAYPLAWLSLMAMAPVPVAERPAVRPARHRITPTWVPTAPLALALTIALVVV